MMSADLTICSVVFNDNSTKLFDLMVRSVLKYTDNPKFIICDNGGNDLAKYKNMHIVSNKSGARGSLQHGESLNKICPLVQTKYTAIVESDVIVLDKNWYITNKKIKGASKGKNLYHMCLFVFETKLFHNADFRPGNKNRLNRSYQSFEDVGWQIGKMIKSEDVELLKFTDCKKDGTVFAGFQSDEFYNIDGKLIGAHFGRGSNLSGKAHRKEFGSNAEQLKNWKKKVEGLLK